MNLRQIVERYKTLAKGYGKPLALESFELPADETTCVFSALDEDYHISRFLDFSVVAGNDKQYSISGNKVSHVRIDEGIVSLL
jgi:hypothetical protein